MNLYDLIPRVLAEAPGATEAEARFSVHETARDFCRTTGAWRVDATAFTITSDTSYTLAGLGTGVVAGRVVEIRDADDNVLSFDDYRFSTDGTTNLLTFTTLPEAGTVLTATMECEPAIAYAGTMDGLVWRYQRPLIADAARKFCEDERHPAYSSRKAQDLLYQYNRGVASAIHERASGGHRGAMLMEGRDWL